MYPSADEAAQNAQQIRSMLGQAGFVLRLLGWPAALQRADVKADGPVLKLGLHLSHDEVLELTDKLQPLLDQNAPKCDAPAPSGG